MTNQTLYKNIIATSDKVALPIDATSLLISTLIVIIGASLFFVSFQFGTESDELSMLCLLLGLCGVAVGLVRMFTHSRKLVYAATGSRLRKHHLYFKKEDSAKVVQLSEKKLGGEVMPKLDANGTVRMDVLFSTDGKFAATQVFVYSECAFLPENDIHVYVDDEACEFAAIVRHIKG